jgi:hypothetical protein
MVSVMVGVRPSVVVICKLTSGFTCCTPFDATEEVVRPVL